ncbi:MAG: hypothetical protein M3317_14490 [Actinomycetota bacterium]|nr:hypothetical protein [Actinomycetota bacterium]
MTTEPQRSFAVSYFDELASELKDDDLALNVEEPNIPPLLTAEALVDGESFDATHHAALTALVLRPFRRFIERFTENKDTTETSLRDLYHVYGDARARIEGYGDVVGTIINRPTTEDHDLNTLILNYLILGKCKTRLGEEIQLPGEDSADKTLNTLLGVVRIISEYSWDTQHTNYLPWLADDESDAAKRFKTWEIPTGKLGDRLASSLGRAAAVGATALVNPFLKLPDEVTVAVAFIAGVQGRKMAELKMHQYLLQNPNVR